MSKLTLLVEHYLVTNDGCTATKIGIDRNSKPTKVSTPVTICSGETYRAVEMVTILRTW
jgi:hypothetical protein